MDGSQYSVNQKKNTGPLVSAVIPTYDRPDLLRGAVESVLNQTYPNIELLVVDDHSSTPAERTLSSISTIAAQPIQVIRHDENKGANVARNTGIKNASGDFIAFLDDDDRWDSTKIERQVSVFQRSDDTVGMVYTGLRIITEDGTTTSIRSSKVSGNVTKQLLSGAQIATFSCIMVRTDVLPQAGLPDERFPSWQDREWYVRLSQHCEFEAIPEPLAIRRVGNHDRIGDNYEEKKNVSYPLFISKHQSLAAKYGPICKRKMVASLTRKLGKQALRQEMYHESREQLLRSAIHYPFAWKTYAYLLVSISGKSGYEIASKSRRSLKKYIFSILHNTSYDK